MSAVPRALRGYRYQPRTVAFQDARPVGRWQVKCTVITVRGTAAHFADIIDGARDQAASLLAGIADDGRDVGVAHLTVHFAPSGVWLLLDWWSEGDILMHRHFHAGFDDPTRFSDAASRHRGPCVWELAVQAYEREAWLRHVLTRGADADIAAYLGSGLSDRL